MRQVGTTPQPRTLELERAMSQSSAVAARKEVVCFQYSSI